MPVAQLNISVWNIDAGSDAASPFIDNVARMNALAERTDGFIWRLLDEGRDEDGHTVLGGPETILTLSVWQSAKHLEAFAFNTVHRKIYERKAEWFAKLQSHHLVMWTIEAGHHPTLDEAKQRLDHLNKHGNTDFAFDWAHLPEVTLWREKRVS
jgi:heme-degrading monooxygenase HmoA